jgi:hypothetical protein
MGTPITTFEVTGSWLSVSAPFVAGNINDPHIEPVSGLVTFTPRLPKGIALYVNDYLVTEAYNSRQQIFLIGNPTAGKWRLRLDAFTTTDLQFSATPAQVKTALEALPNVGSGNVQVTSPAPDAFSVEFIGALAETSMVRMIPFSSLSNADLLSCPISVTIADQGTPQVVSDTAVVLPPLTGRIWRGRLSTIDSVDSPGVRLAANAPNLGIAGELIYDVLFSKVSYNGRPQVLAPFAFAAPTTDTAVCITDPSLERLLYDKPIADAWLPSQPKHWRLRAV